MRKSQVSQTLRRRVVERAQGCCEYCLSQEQFSTQAFSIDHIIPVEKGGDTTFENLALSCQGCNNHKYTKIAGYDPVTHQIVPLYHPRQQIWNEHFAWNDDCTVIIGPVSYTHLTLPTKRIV